jgi:hypothetical protein
LTEVKYCILIIKHYFDVKNMCAEDSYAFSRGFQGYFTQTSRNNLLSVFSPFPGPEMRVQLAEKAPFSTLIVKFEPWLTKHHSSFLPTYIHNANYYVSLATLAPDDLEQPKCLNNISRPQVTCLLLTVASSKVNGIAALIIAFETSQIKSSGKTGKTARLTLLNYTERVVISFFFRVAKCEETH